MGKGLCGESRGRLSPYYIMLFHTEICIQFDKMLFYPTLGQGMNLSQLFPWRFFFLFSTVYCILCALAFIFSNLLRYLAPAFLFPEWRSLAFLLCSVFLVGIWAACFLLSFLFFLYDMRALRENEPIYCSGFASL